VQGRRIDERSREELEQALLRERQTRARLERLRLVQQHLSGSLNPEEVRTALLALATGVEGSSAAMLVKETRGVFAYRCRDGGAETTGVLENGSSALRAIVAARTARAELAVADDDGRRLAVLDLGGDESGRESSSSTGCTSHSATTTSPSSRSSRGRRARRSRTRASTSGSTGSPRRSSAA
jgi:hypothetical protein